MDERAEEITLAELRGLGVRVRKSRVMIIKGAA